MRVWAEVFWRPRVRETIWITLLAAASSCSGSGDSPGPGAPGGAGGSSTTGSATSGASSTTSGSTSTAGSGGSSGSTTAAGSAGTGGSAGTTGGTGGTGSTGGTGGTGGTGVGSACSGQTPAGAAMCGPGRTCLATSCAPPVYDCFPGGSGVEGGPCLASTDCGAGMTCIRYTTTFLACRILCTSDPDCPTGYGCLGSFTCGTTTPAGKFCQKVCSDITEAGSAACGAGIRCDVGCTAQVPTPPTCGGAAGTLRSGACTTNSNCAAGFVCLNSVCTQTCTTNADCTMGTCIGTLACGAIATNFHFCN